ncbi:transglutaminase family protein [Lignipirellula cremea]|uniref:Serine protease HtrA n=1 Tax=Lignipirellula cremea TaxID=2528010 RepID=A0A518DPX8_9BACT|nr:tetratricopeptide repeat protein [Lignipirellula cremea]QDU93888.1 Putative serine protease HtrA [Lignipirellula cremea]
MTRSLTLLLAFLCCSRLAADDVPPEPERPVETVAAATVEELAETALKSVVVVTFTGRDGKRQGLGAGFLVSEDGLIATNYHVLGEARPIAVELADGRSFDVVSIHASDRRLDLAVIKIEGDNLPPPLELGRSKTLRQGAPVVAFGNPQGLKLSVVSGVVSGRREIDGRQMIQIAVPIEPGNSGGPLLDAYGKVHGIVTAKSLVTDNLGFAVEVDDLKPLLEKPNPIPMSRWLTIGALDARQWSLVNGGKWRRQSGTIVASEPGDGFGGRSLCLWEGKTPELPYEIGVQVKLDDESGAAGLVFQSNGAQRHYGFYPSAGNLRLSSFMGPDFRSWKVLRNEASPHYRSGEWNYLKVRLEKDRVRCFLNDELVYESTDESLPPGKVGLAKFRDTTASFKGFRIGKELPRFKLDPAVAAGAAEALRNLPSLAEISGLSLDPLEDQAAIAATVLRDQAHDLERQAADRRRLAQDLLTRSITLELEKMVKQHGENVDLLHGALLLSRLDNEDLDTNYYEQRVAEMAAETKASLPAEPTDAQKLQALNRYLFEQNGFHGGRTNYYHRANSYLDQVIEDREGLPITLSVLYLEVGRRLGLKLEGVGLPGHFIVKLPQGDEDQLIDVFERGETLSKDNAKKIVDDFAGRAFQETDLQPASARSILVRMLHNLNNTAQREDDKEAMLRYVEAMVALEPDSVSHRGLRAVLNSETGRKVRALADLDWILDQQPAGIDLDAVQRMRDYFESR